MASTYRLTQHTFFDEPLDSVVDFFNTPENLEKLTPSFLSFKILTPAPILMHNGAVFDYEIRLFGIKMVWQSIISNYDPPHGFVDIQLKGPYQFWHHKHSFIKHTEYVEVIDDVHYSVGYGILGRIAHALFIRKQLEAIFNYRKSIFSNRKLL